MYHTLVHTVNLFERPEIILNIFLQTALLIVRISIRPLSSENHFRNMAEPQSSPPPPNPDADDPLPVVPTNAEDRKAAAALSSLDAHDEDEGKPNGKGTNNIDQEALGRAISRLEMSSGVKGVGGKEDEKAKAKGKEEAGKKIKVDQADVGLLVSLFHFPPFFAGSHGPF